MKVRLWLPGRWPITEVSPRTHFVPDTMRAWHLNSYSGTSALRLSTDTVVPRISHPDHVLVRVHAASVNPLDNLMCHGYGFGLFDVMRCASQPFPLILGRDFSGVVVDRGMNVTDLPVGQPVWGSVWPSLQGSHAEYVVINQCLVDKKPEQIGHTEAASIPYAALTAWSALVSTGNVEMMSEVRRNVLVIGASGGVGTMAIQLLNAWNHQVVAVCRQDAFKMVSELGAASCLDYSDPDFAANLSKSGPFDLIVSCVTQSKDEDGGKQLLRHLKKNSFAKFVTVSSPLLRQIDTKGLAFGVATSAMELLQHNLQHQFGSYRWAYYWPSRSALKQIGRMVDDKKIKPVVEQVYDWSQMRDAYDKVAQGHARGKVVVSAQAQ